jgi:molybdopterin synthase sulfur carrier subunit
MPTPITLLYFAQLRETFGRSEEQLELPDDVKTVDELIQHLSQRGGIWQEQLGGDKAFRVALNQEMAPGHALVPAHAEVAIFKPVTGG